MSRIPSTSLRFVFWLVVVSLLVAVMCSGAFWNADEIVILFGCRNDSALETRRDKRNREGLNMVGVALD